MPRQKLTPDRWVPRGLFRVTAARAARLARTRVGTVGTRLLSAGVRQRKRAVFRLQDTTNSRKKHSKLMRKKKQISSSHDRGGCSTPTAPNSLAERSERGCPAPAPGPRPQSGEAPTSSTLGRFVSRLPASRAPPISVIDCFFTS